MARKVREITVEAEGRDKGRLYILTEMPAVQAERWATRAFLALARSGVDLPEGVQQMGLAGLVTVGLKALGGVSFEDAAPLLDEMLRCAKFVPDPARPMTTRPVDDTNTEEVATLVMLRREIMSLHVDFSRAGALLT